MITPVNKRRSLLVKGTAVLLTFVAAPILGIVMTPKREAVAQAAEEAQVAAPKTPTTAPTGNFIGVLLPPQMATLTAYGEGRVDHVDVKLGQPVKKGQMLIAFDRREAEQMLAAAEGQVKGAQAAAGAAGAEAAAARAAMQRNSGTIDWNGQKISIVAKGQEQQARFDAAAAAARAGAAAAQIAEARARVEQLKVQLEHTEFRAPFDGVVTQLNFEQGATVHQGQPVVRVVGGQGLRARIAIPEESAGVWQGRRRAQLALDDAKAGKVFWAILDQVAPEVEPASRTYFVEGPLAATQDLCGGDCAMLAGRPVRATLISDKE